MKRFKKFLIEEMSTDTVSQDTTPTAHNPQTDPPAPSMFAPDSVKQNYNKFVTQRAETPSINQGEQPEAEDEDAPKPPLSYEEWMRENPMPDSKDYDTDGDGVLNDEERRAYEEAWQDWQRYYEWWLDDWQDYYWHLDRPPDRWYEWDPNSNEPWTPGEWQREFDEWWERRNPDSRDPNRPTREDYEYFREIWERLQRQIGDINPNHPFWREYLDWLFQLHEWQRGGQQGPPPTPPPLFLNNQ
jgi:hypothetical protein